MTDTAGGIASAIQDRFSEKRAPTENEYLGEKPWPFVMGRCRNREIFHSSLHCQCFTGKWSSSPYDQFF